MPKRMSRKLLRCERVEDLTEERVGELAEVARRTETSLRRCLSDLERLMVSFGLVMQASVDCIDEKARVLQGLRMLVRVVEASTRDVLDARPFLEVLAVELKRGVN